MLKIFEPVKGIFMIFGFIHTIFGVEMALMNIFNFNAKLMGYCGVSVILGISCIFFHYKIVKACKE